MTTYDRHFDPGHRARVVAGIRALADLIEGHLDLPVPQSISAQHSIIGDLDDAGRQRVIDAATSLGVEPEISDYRATASHRVATNGTGESYFGIGYTVHGNRPKPEEDTQAVTA